jgi:hypothetical protein
MTGAYLEYNSANKGVNRSCGWIFASFIPDVIDFAESNTGARVRNLDWACWDGIEQVQGPDY